VLLTIVRRFGDEARGQRPVGMLGGNEVNAIHGQERLTDEQANAMVCSRNAACEDGSVLLTVAAEQMLE
jgi:hypothetical protein